MIITIRGGGIITDTTPGEYALTYKGKQIIIFAQEKETAGLEKLFTYRGLIEIKSCKVIFTNSRPQNIGIQRVMKDDRSINLNIKPDDMTLNTEEYYHSVARKDRSGKKFTKISLAVKTRDNIVSSVPFWTKENKPYIGKVHYHLDGKRKGQFETGGVHTSESKILTRLPLSEREKPAVVNPTLKRFMRYLKK
tara:strand:- start:51 stop:629 length:579 start_codon:yes stop_codon:yes gene_type:complete